LARDRSIDALRGLAIILVVVGHAFLLATWVLHPDPALVQLGPSSWIPLATATNPLLNLIYSFHMPLFAFVSGLVMWPSRDSPLGGQIVQRARGLLLPYLTWFVITFVVARDVIALPPEGFGAALSDIVIGRRGLGGLWYLYALFVCTAIVICLERAPKPRRVLTASALVVVAWSTGLIPVGVPDVLYLRSVMWVYPFVIFGYLLRRAESRVADHRLSTIALASAVFLPLFYLRNPIFVPDLAPMARSAVALHNAGIRGGSLAVGLVPYACALAAVLALYGLYTSRQGQAVEIQAWLGRRSLGIYAMQGPLLLWMVNAGIKNVLVLSIVAVGVSAASTAVLERVPVLKTVLLGQRNSTRSPAQEPSLSQEPPSEEQPDCPVSRLT
jgi:fucose 4-O-acetylase-like acetyltransferase